MIHRALNNSTAPNFDALDVGADDQRRRDDRKRHLKHKEDGFGNVARQGVGPDAGQERLAETADDRVGAAAIAEGQAIDADKPQDRHETGDGKTMHQDGQHVLRAHQAAVKKRQPPEAS